MAHPRGPANGTDDDRPRRRDADTVFELKTRPGGVRRQADGASWIGVGYPRGTADQVLRSGAVDAVAVEAAPCVERLLAVSCCGWPGSRHSWRDVGAALLREVRDALEAMAVVVAPGISNPRQLGVRAELFPAVAPYRSSSTRACESVADNQRNLPQTRSRSPTPMNRDIGVTAISGAKITPDIGRDLGVRVPIG